MKNHIAKLEKNSWNADKTTASEIDGKKRMKNEIEFVIGVAEIGYNTPQIVLSPNVELFYINLVIDFNGRDCKYTYIKGKIQYNDISEIIPFLFEEIENICTANLNLNLHGFKVFLLDNLHIRNRDTFEIEAQAELNSLSIQKKIELPVAVEPLMRGSFVRILGSHAGMYGQWSDELTNRERLENYYGFFLHYKELALESLKYLLNNEEEFIEALMFKPGITDYMITNGIITNTSRFIANGFDSIQIVNLSDSQCKQGIDNSSCNDGGGK